MILTKEHQKYHHCHLEKNDKYEYLTALKTLPSDKRRVIEQDKFVYFLLGKAFKKQKKSNWRWRTKTKKSLKDHGKWLVKSSSEK